MKRKQALIINISIVAVLFIALAFLVLYQTGKLDKNPVVETVAENCYEETLYVISDDDYSPYSFFDEEGKPSGHDIELINIIANRMHMNLDLRLMEWDEGIEAINAGEADVLMTCGYSDNFEGLEKLNMSDPVSVDDYAVYSKQKFTSADYLYGNRIAIMRDGNVTPQIEMMNLSKYVIEYDDNRLAMIALENGEADFAVMRQNVGDSLIQELGYRDIVADISIGQSFMCFGIRPGNPELEERINQAIEELKISGELEALSEKWLTTFIRPYTLKEVLYRDPWIAYLFIILVGAFFMVFYINKRREDKDHEEQMEKEQAMQEKLQDALNRARELNIKYAEQGAFTSFFLKPYQSAYYVSLDTLNCQIYKRTEELERNYPIITNFVDSLNDYIQKEVHPDDREQLRMLVNPENMKATLLAVPEFSFVYRIITGNEDTYCRLQVIRGADENHAAFGFREVTDEIRDQKERADRLKQADDYRSIVDHFIVNFEVSYIVNFEEDTYKPLKRRQDVYERYYRDDLAFSDLFMHYTESVYAPDREAVRVALNLQSIREGLETKSEFVVRYRSLFSGTPVWYEMHVMKINDKEIILAFANVDDIVSTEQSRKAVFGDYFGVYVADIQADTVKVIKRARDRFKGKLKNAEDSYSATVSEYIKLLPDKYKKEWEGLDTPEGLKKFFGNANKRDLIFESVYKANTYVRCSWYVIERIDDDPHLICFAFSDLDEMQADREILNEKIAHQKNLLDYFVESYESAYSIDLLNDTFEVQHIEHDRTVNITPVGDRDKMAAFIDEHIHPDDRELMRQMIDKQYIINRLRNEKSFSFTVREMFDGVERTMKAQIIRGIDEYHIAVGFMDITASIEKEKEQQDQLKEALAMAQSANKAKTTFLNNMSHDIRTPMNAIIGYAGLAASHIDNKDQVQDYLAKISQSSDHLLSLINDVLDMSRIESGKMHLEEREENLSDIIHTLRDIVQADVHSRSLDFYVDAVDVNDEDIICDKLRLNQILLNILSNAIKYTPSGGTVTMRVAEKTVKANGYGTYVFSVKDNGIGMKKEFLDHIFDPFERAKSSTVSGIQGTGLGMAITKNIVDMMGAKIEIQSEAEKGTEVTVTFDFKLQNLPKKPIAIPELNGVRGLVVDDDTGTCMSVAKMIKDIGMRPDWCTSGKEAVIRAEEAYRNGDSFRVYIIDWLMPDMNGIETARRVRKVVGDDVPIIILTAYDWSDIEEEAREAGVNAFVSKPMFPSDLHRVLNSCLGKEEEAAPVKRTTGEFAGRKVLLVEDNELNREIATELLREFGFVVASAENGNVAVEKMRNAQTGDYDIVLMDVQMPTMDGYEATRQIRALGTEISKIPILAMSANAFEEDRKAALEAGMDDHIAKPIDVTNLKETLSKFL